MKHQTQTPLRGVSNTKQQSGLAGFPKGLRSPAFCVVRGCNQKRIWFNYFAKTIGLEGPSMYGSKML